MTRIKHIHIDRWRCFEGVSLSIPTEAPLVCLVGENGTGKSSILELIGDALRRIGLTPVRTEQGGTGGLEMESTDSARIAIALDIDPERRLVEHGGSYVHAYNADERARLINAYMEWDQSIEVRYVGSANTPTLRAGGIADDWCAGFVADLIVRYFRQDMDLGLKAHEATRYFHLGAIRWLPPFGGDSIAGADLSHAGELPVDLRNYVAQEMALRMQDYRQRYAVWRKNVLPAVERGEDPGPKPEPPPPPTPLFLAKVLPYLIPAKVDQATGETVYQSRSREIPFSGLSSGEKDVVAVGVLLEDLAAERPVILFDEPELHMNPELVRRRLHQARDQVRGGQMIIATHSFEAIEVVGEGNTIILTRSQPDGPVDRAQFWSEDQVFSALAAALGMPAFSLAGKRFVFVEGKDRPAVVKRFDCIGGNDPSNYFIPEEGWRTVLSRLAMFTKWIADDRLQRQIRIGAIVDHDFRSAEEIKGLEAQGQVYVLRCRDEENLFLEPESATAYLRHMGEDRSCSELLHDAANQHAGKWIRLSAMSSIQKILGSKLNDRHMVGEPYVTWTKISEDPDAWISRIVNDHHLEETKAEALDAALRGAIRAYADLLDHPELWKWCLGKLTLETFCELVEVNVDEYIDAIALRWKHNPSTVPAVIRDLRSWLANLEPPLPLRN